MEKESKKRSPNYTLEEKENLLSIAAKYKGVIECKKTGAYFIQRKKEAWTSITKQYNSVCTSGPRAEAMLKHLYNNMKHRARKVSANENKQKYINEILTEHHNNSQSVHEVNENIAVEEIKDAIIIEESHEDFETDSIAYENKIKDLTKKWTDEKKNITKTGGGTFIPTLTDTDHQILSILDDQIRPDMNPFDEAAEYFGETVKGGSPDPFIQPSQEPKLVERKQKNKFIYNKKRDNVKVACSKKSAELLKKIYFRKKIDLTFYQKKTEMLKFRNEQKRHQMELKKYDLEIKILQKQLEKV